MGDRAKTEERKMYLQVRKGETKTDEKKRLFSAAPGDPRVVN